jgi:membrane-bound acyltransferase YfiQ involved in biofilm formation
VCWLLFFSAALEKLEDHVDEEGADLAEKKSESRRSFLDVLSEYSMIIYLIHPLFLYYWLQWFRLLGFSIAQVPVVVFYVLVLATSLLAGMVIHKLAKKCRLIGLALLGRQPQ